VELDLLAVIPADRGDSNPNHCETSFGIPRIDFVREGLARFRKGESQIVSIALALAEIERVPIKSNAQWKFVDLGTGEYIRTIGCRIDP
jgi:hypothetical protein